jgi:hypothetical protein
VLLGLLLFAGCNQEVTHVETAVERENRLIQFGVNNLPNESKKVMDLGNGWYTFDLEIDGKNRRFLYHKVWNRTYGEYPVMSESLTELTP